jgi:hypothetical protein
MSCDHPLDAEFLYPSDAAVVDLFDGTDGLAIRLALPCPECGETLELIADVGAVREADYELPLEDAEEQYD